MVLHNGAAGARGVRNAAIKHSGCDATSVVLNVVSWSMFAVFGSSRRVCCGLVDRVAGCCVRCVKIKANVVRGKQLRVAALNPVRAPPMTIGLTCAVLPLHIHRFRNHVSITIVRRPMILEKPFTTCTHLSIKRESFHSTSFRLISPSSSIHLKCVKTADSLVQCDAN